MANNIVPNSFQYPNFLVDKLDYYLSPTETKVLLKAVREILGWNDKIPLRKNPISLSVFVTGKPTKGVMGCGLGIGAVREALESLDKFHILVKVGEPTQDGQMYWLQDDDTKIDWAALEDRRAKWDAVSKKRTQEATIKSLEKRGITSDVIPTSDATLTSDVTRSNVGRNSSVTSDVNKETHDETHLETQGGAAEKPPPLSRTLSDLPEAEKQASILLGNGNSHPDYEGDLIKSRWRISSSDHKDAIVMFLAASRLPIPFDKSERKRWIANVDIHIQQFGLGALADLYARAVARLRGDDMTIGAPGSLTKTMSDIVAKGQNGNGKDKPHARPANDLDDYSRRAAAALKARARPDRPGG